MERGGHSYESGLVRRFSPEDPYGRGIEVRGNAGAEDHSEEENPCWLSGIVNPEKIRRAKEYPAYEGHSDEYIIMDALLATIVERGPDLNPTVKRRLRNLIGIFRITAFQNMTPQEQAFLTKLSHATTVDFSSLQYEVNQDAREDIRWIWKTFDLSVPQSNTIQRFLAG